ncbi:MAG: hypothetical protein A2086_04880 [Spirochaetes bacterium GWD1_27_9]|nr:MAG: hypothetical protein A2Z98_04295 [Spirochaetes bacterium GWB1_27_13]OHD27640.1 MAG: hypothetical protein A2Y34_00335 [Spirochaetes bacterium GWC1_27_15]OHD31950.1 MAG: hypothetical protein A2086_04880 [Spirochaetes bacterium GWD1_27_9]
MKMSDWDTASFDNFKNIIVYFKLEEIFKKVFEKDLDSFKLKDEMNKYDENNLINFCLNWLNTPPNIIWFSGYNEETNLFDVNKIEIEPKDITDAKEMIKYLQEYTSK